MHQSTELGVATSKIHNVEGSQVNKFWTFRHLHPALLSDGYHNGTLSPTPWLLPQKFTSSEDLTFTACLPPTRSPCTVQRRLPKWHMPTHGGRQSTKFEPCVAKGFICRLQRMNRCENYVHVPCRCSVYPGSTLHLYSVVMPFS